MKRFYPLIFFILFALPMALLQGQIPRSFDLGDFQLEGPVKRCIVKAPYGTETYEFDRLGRLIRTDIRYNERDYDITYYRFGDSLLNERRDEVYRDKIFDAGTSIAHFYSRDSALGKHTEVITSYDKSLREQVDRYFDEAGRLIRIVHTNTNGTDETTVEHTTYKGEQTATYLRNDIVIKTVRRSRKQLKGEGVTVELTKTFLEGSPEKATEITYDSEEKKLREIQYHYDLEKASFRPEKTMTYTYGPEGLPATETTEYHPAEGTSVKREKQIREFVYQMDGSDTPNWVRQIITPENTFVVRTIDYFEPEQTLAEIDSVGN